MSTQPQYITASKFSSSQDQQAGGPCSFVFWEACTWWKSDRLRPLTGRKDPSVESRVRPAATDLSLSKTQGKAALSYIYTLLSALYDARSTSQAAKRKIAKLESGARHLATVSAMTRQSSSVHVSGLADDRNRLNSSSECRHV